MILDSTLRVVHGDICPSAFSAYCVVNNEMFFLPAFLDHYRAKGVEQFIFADDRSTDGTAEFLCSQRDCVIVNSNVRFGDSIEGQRAVIVWRTTIPHRFLMGKWAICVDADEFLHPPLGFNSFQQFTAALDEKAIRAVAAVMIDHYPSDVGGFADARPPATAAELFQRYPWFDRGPYIRWPEGEERPIVLHGGVRERLFQRYGISTRSMFKPFWTVVLRRLRRKFGGDRNIQSIHKVPLVKWREDIYYEHSHTLNVPPAPGILLALSHFKFTAVLKTKIEQAIRTAVYADNSRLYHGYKLLLERMGEVEDGFVDANSVRYASPEDYKAAGISKCYIRAGDAGKEGRH